MTSPRTRRKFTADFKRRVLREVDEALASGKAGAVRDLLRREGLYSSHLTGWRRERDAGELAGLTPKKRGRKPSGAGIGVRLARLEARVRGVEEAIETLKAGSEDASSSPMPEPHGASH